MRLVLLDNYLLSLISSHDGTSDYFDVDSYSGVIDYEDNTGYTSDTTGDKFELRDVLDFKLELMTQVQ